MDPGGEAEGEGEEEGMVIMEAPAPGGRDQEGTLVPTEESEVGDKWMDLMHPAGAEMMQE